MSIELKPGDYVLTEDISGEDGRAIVAEFRRAGCDMQHYDGYSMGHSDFFRFENVGWSMSSGFAGGVAEFNRRRRLSPGQILDAEPGIDVTSMAAEPPAWDGGGLPPVGCECEWKHKRADDGQWVPCQIVGYHDEWVFVVDGSNSGMPAVKKVATWRFRPIRSEEDRAVDAMLAVVECSEGHYTLCGPMADAMRELYRAGLRFPKEVT